MKRKANDSNGIESMKIEHKKKKVAFCPIIQQMLEKKNHKRIKPSTVYSMLDFFDFKEKLKMRLLCKMFNKCIRTKLAFLQKENFILMTRKMREEVQEEYNENSKGSLLDKSMLFQSSEKKFSKKKTLIKLINSNNYINIKKQVSLGKLILPKQLTH